MGVMCYMGVMCNRGVMGVIVELWRYRGVMAVL